MKASACPHFDGREAPPRAPACEACGETWALRACTTCGHVGCCESSQAHNRAHWEATGHPLIREVSTGMRGFLWCYACAGYLD